MKRIILSEEEKNDITSQHDDIDRSLMNYLLRRVKVEDRNIGDDDHPINVKEVSFEGTPGYGFNSFLNRKEMQKRVLNFLEETEKVSDEDVIYYSGEFNKDRQKTMRTIRAFLNFIIPKR